MIRAIALLLVMGSSAGAHDFYSQFCCSGKDCVEAPEGSVNWTPNGWAISQTHELIPFDDPRIQPMPKDERGIRICQIPSIPTIRCLYIPDTDG